LGSVAGIRDSPGLFMYQTSKNGILGLMRSMRRILYERDRIRVNCVCPGMTDTAMTSAIIGNFRVKGGHFQSADDVAKVILGVQCDASINGKAIYVECGKGWEFEDGLYDTMPQWLGDEPTRLLRENSKLVAQGALLR